MRPPLKISVSKLNLKKAYQYDYRIVRDGKVKYCRAKFVNTSDGGQLHRMVAGFSDISSEKQRELERMAYVDSVTMEIITKVLRRKSGISGNRDIWCPWTSTPLKLSIRSVELSKGMKHSKESGSVFRGYWKKMIWQDISMQTVL